MGTTIEYRKTHGLCLRCGGTIEPEREGLKWCGSCSLLEKQKRANRNNERKSLGLCTRCGRPKENPLISTCDACNKKAAEANRKQKDNISANHRKTVEKRKEEGLCVGCGGVLEPKRTRQHYCISCTEKINRRRKARYSKRKEQGLCARCGKPKEDAGKIFCTVCDTKARISYGKEKTIQQERKEEGLCVYCGGAKEPERMRFLSCAGCSKKQAESSKRSQLKYLTKGSTQNEYND